MPVSSAELTPLQRRAARGIVALVRREGLVVGDHVPEVQIATDLGSSRSPVQAALRHLAGQGLLQRDANRGYFLARDAAGWADVAAGFDATSDDPLYLRVVQDRHGGVLAREVSESELMRRYGVARSTLRKVLARISEEGWIEQRIGQGWCFRPMIDSADAYEESYLFRQAIEPTGLLGPSFHFVPAEMAALKQEQQRIADGGYKGMTPIEFFEANSRFHETVAGWSNNRFIVQSVRRVNQQRRLVEYRITSLRKPQPGPSAEHLQILAAIEAGGLALAAERMRDHLAGARRGKSRGKTPFA